MDMTDEIADVTEELETETVEELEVTEEIIVDHPETPQETANAVYQELKAKADAEEAAKGPQEEDPDNEISEAARKLGSARKGKKRQTFVPADQEQPGGAKPVGEAVQGEKLEPPADWSVEDKEWFHAQPPKLQKNYIEREKKLLAQTNKHWQEYSRETANARAINEVTEKYYPKLGTKLSKAEVIDQLFKYQQQINEDSVGAIADMIRHRGVTLEEIEARMAGQTKPPPREQAPQPQQKYLTEQELEQKLAAREAEIAQRQTVTSATEEVRSLASEMQNGRYLWPEMHSAETIQGIQDLVSYFRKTTPNDSWKDTYKKAIVQHRANTGSPSPTSSRLTPQEIQTVRQASSSLRSRGGNGAIPVAAEPKANETARESAEISYWQTIGKNQH